MGILRNRMYAGKSLGLRSGIVNLDADGCFEVSDEEYAELIGLKGFESGEVVIEPVAEPDQGQDLEVEPVEESVLQEETLSEGESQEAESTAVKGKRAKKIA